jgi:hypothetical protein
MSATRLLITFALVLLAYSLILVVCYRPLTRPGGVRYWQSRKPVETTTAEEQARGQSSFIIRRERGFGTDRQSFFVLAMFGYVVLLIGFAIAFIVLSRSGHP